MELVPLIMKRVLGLLSAEGALPAWAELVHAMSARRGCGDEARAVMRVLNYALVYQRAAKLVLERNLDVADVRHLRGCMRPQLPNDPLDGMVSRNRSVMRPHGVWVVIAPFNFPLALAGGPVAAALVTGNTVVDTLQCCCPTERYSSPEA